jgi:hypothetical protein
MKRFKGVHWIIFIVGLISILTIVYGKKGHRVAEEQYSASDENRYNGKETMGRGHGAESALYSENNASLQDGLADKGYSKTEPDADIRSRSNERRTAEIMSEFLASVQSKDAGRIKQAIDNIRHCESCIEDLKKVLFDESFDDAARCLAASALIQIETKSPDPVLAVIDALKQSESLEQSELMAGLAAALTNVDLYDVEAMVSVLLRDKDFARDLPAMSEEVKRIIEKTIRIASENKAIGQLLSERYLAGTTTGDGAQELEDIGHPGMYSELVKQRYESGDAAAGSQLMKCLAGGGNSESIGAIVWLSGNASIPMDDVLAAVERWGENQSDERVSEMLAQALTDYGLDARQRAVAAQALATTADLDVAYAILTKASEHEPDQVVGSQIASALNLIEKRLEQRNQKTDG